MCQALLLQERLAIGMLGRSVAEQLLDVAIPLT